MNLDELCANCGLTYGSHRGDSISRDQCPQHEGRMDWPMLALATWFAPSGEYGDVPRGTPSKAKETAA